MYSYSEVKVLSHRIKINLILESKESYKCAVLWLFNSLICSYIII